MYYGLASTTPPLYAKPRAKVKGGCLSCDEGHNSPEALQGNLLLRRGLRGLCAGLLKDSAVLRESVRFSEIFPEGDRGHVTFGMFFIGTKFVKLSQRIVCPRPEEKEV